MKIVLDDIECRKDLFPFTLTRSAADIRIGILTIREKWEKLTGKKIITVSELLENDVDHGGIIIPANVIPSRKSSKSFFIAISLY